MINPKFYLKDNKSAESIIMMTVWDNKKSLRFSTKRKIKSTLWDSDRQRPITNKGVSADKKKEFNRTIKKEEKINPQIKTQLININNHLENLRIDCITIYENINREFKSVDLKILKTRLLEKYFPKKNHSQKNTLSMNDYIEDFLQKIESGERKIQSGKNIGKVYAKSSVKTLKEWHTQFKNFQKAIRKKLNWEDINEDLYMDYVAFFEAKENSYNTIGKHVKNLKAIMQYGLHDKQHDKENFKNFKVYQTDITKVVLDEDEVNLLYNNKFKDKIIQKDVDVFLLSCYTTLRFSDASRIEPKHIDLKTNTINIIAKKTKKPLSIPINNKLKKILRKYNYKMPDTNAQRLNRNIKIACKKLGINKLVEVKSIRGGITKTEHIEKWKLISTHTGRRSACTNMYLSGIKPLLIMKLSGHSKENTFMKYIVLENDKSAKLLAKNKFFN